MTGKISSVENHGSIVIIWLGLDDDTREPIYMEHRAFAWMAEAEVIETAGDLVGRPVCYDGESIHFIDNVEAA
jgi:hypothetical protein